MSGASGFLHRRLSLRAWESCGGSEGHCSSEQPCHDLCYFNMGVGKWESIYQQGCRSLSRTPLSSGLYDHHDLYSPRLRKRNRGHSHSHHTKKKQRIRVSLFMCICYRQTDKDRWSHHPTPAPGEAVHRLLHTCGSPAAAHSVSDQLWWQLWRWGVSSDGSQEAEGGQEGPEMSRGQRVRLEGSSCSQARAQSRKAATRKLTSGPWQRELGEVRAAPECPN